MPDLEGDGVSLRKLQQGDRSELVDALADQTDLFSTLVPSERNFDDWFSQLKHEKARERNWAYAIRGPEGTMCGTTSFMRIAEPHRRLEVGRTVLSRSAQRTGINLRCKLLLLEHAFDTLNCHVVQLRTDWLNRRSRSAIEGLGAKMDGVLRGHRIMPDGHIRDTVVFSIIQSEWAGVRSSLMHRLTEERR